MGNWHWLHFGYTPNNPAAIENRFPILKRMKLPLLILLLLLLVVLFLLIFLRLI